MAQVFYLQFFFWVLANGFAPSISPLGPGENCLECHKKMIDFPQIHAPAGESCLACHVSTGVNHPKDGTNGFSLKMGVPDLCHECHAKWDSKISIHAPVKEGQCGICHSPHGSPTRYLLKATTSSSLCTHCHATDPDSAGVNHPPYRTGNCTACHNPHQSDLSHLLKDSSQQVCLNCHDTQKKELAKEFIHAPFAENCLLCHSGHKSDQAGLLSKPTPALCFSCHEELLTSSNKAHIKHSAFDTRSNCMNCHSPHASSHPNMLLKENKLLCLTCHSRTIKRDSSQIENIGLIVKKSPFQHKVIEDEGCTPCHAPHYSENHTLLKDSYPEGKYSDTRKGGFDLCFNCHDAGLFEDAKTTSSTGFRQGPQNLHFLHVNRTKGRNCNLCHGIHGAAFEHLISERVRFGKWDLPIKYSANQAGGTCAPGCHLPRSYTR